MRWRLDRIILQGFKSFRDRTLLDFPEEVTGIIGPNGSGKSNLVEAIRFATGARFRELRGGEERKALFFGGEEGRVLEVRLEFSRDRERLVLERRLEGEKSLLRLNGRPATWRQVGLALAGTGLVRGYAVVGQGEVGRVLEAPSGVLLSALEEAAGLRPVAEALRQTGERLKEAEALLLEKSQESLTLEERLRRLAEEAERVRRARSLQGRILAVRRGVFLARKRETEEELERTRQRLSVLEEEARGLLEGEKALEEERARLLEEKRALEEEVHRLKGEVQALLALRREEAQLKGLLARLKRPTPPEPGPPPPPPPMGLEEVERRRRALQEEIKALRALQARTEAERLAYEKAKARYEALLEAHRQALAEREAAERALKEKEEALRALEDLVQRRLALEEKLQALRGEEKALRQERIRLERLLAEGVDLSEGARRVRGGPGILGVVVDLLQVPKGYEAAVEAALGPRLQWVLAQDEEAAKRAIEVLKQKGGRATFLPLTLLPKPRPPLALQAPGALGPLAHLVGLDLALGQAEKEAFLHALFGETWLFEDLEKALAYFRASRNPPRIVTLEGEVLDRSGALTGGRPKGGGEGFRLRARLRELRREEAKVKEAMEEAEKALSAFPEPQALSLLRAEVSTLRRTLSRPLPPLPSFPKPPKASEVQGRLQALEEERARLEEVFAQALAYERYLEAKRRWDEHQALQKERETIQARLAEIGHALGVLASLEEALKAREAQLKALEARLRDMAQREARLLTRRNQLASERENLRVGLARKEAVLEGVLAELSLLPEEAPALSEEDGRKSSRQLSQELARLEAELARLGPVNPLAEREEKEAREAYAQKVQALEEARLAALKLKQEMEKTQNSYETTLLEALARFREAFNRYAQALLNAEGVVARTPEGLELGLRLPGKRVRDLRLFSLGEKTLGALAFLFALGEVQGGLPIAILDEVDAALDEANLMRFASFLKGRQFILVTHQKRTMEACQALYGVTHEGGVSRVYAIRKEEV